jgi:sterol desaturase/sphingolipid hydroxylase (fatty acid hydroxylase superfamily)
MRVSYIALAIPVFFALMGLEQLWARREGKRLYRLNDSVNDLSCGILQQLLGVFTKTAVFGGYLFFYRYRQLEVSMDSAWAWLALFLGVDFFYYWFHRSGHEMNLVWAAHVVHHQSEEMNLAVALRQSSFQHLFSAVFYWPLAWIGFPPLMFLAVESFNTLYQFWIHTRLIGKLGPLEWVFNTPSHHRVHHGCNPKYIDRNHGGTLIIWDRWFGTFQAEEEEPHYGISKPLRNWNPFWANFHYWVELMAHAKAASSWREKLLIWFRSPATTARGSGSRAAAPRERPEKYDASAPARLRGYILTQFVVLVVAATCFLWRFDQLPGVGRAVLAGLIVWSVLNFGAVFEGKRWFLPAELGRIVFAVLAVAALTRGSTAFLQLTVLGGLLAFGSAIWLWDRWTRGVESRVEVVQVEGA